MILSSRTIGLVLTIVFLTGGAAWSVTTHLPPASASDGSGRDYGLDTDGNGTFEWFVVEADVSLPEAGMWDVYADLSSSTPPEPGPCGPGGTPIPIRTSDATTPIAWVYERYFFPAGPQTVRMAFDGTTIARAAVDGPYAVHARLSLGRYPYAEMGRPEPIPNDGFLEWNYTSRAYRAAEFEPPVRPAFFIGPHTDAEVDVDSDGLADFLELTAKVQVELEGHYTLYGTLTESAGSDYVRAVAYAYRDFELTVADTEVFLRFRGDQIRRAGVDGPWDFALSLWGPMGPPYLNATARPEDGLRRPGVFYPEMLCGSTAAYRAADFDDTVEFLRYTGRFGEGTPDMDGDGLHDMLVVRAEVEVLLAAGFDVSGVLRPDGGSVELAHAAGQVWLPEGDQWVEFVFPGGMIRGSGVDGPYDATLSLTPSQWGIDPETTYTTRAYRAEDFDDMGGTRRQWIGGLSAEAVGETIRISATVVRGNDPLTDVIEDAVEVLVTDSAGTLVESFKERVFLTSGGSQQSFSFTLEGIASGRYTITVVLGPADRPVDTRTVQVTV